MCIRRYIYIYIYIKLVSQVILVTFHNYFAKQYYLLHIINFSNVALSIAFAIFSYPSCVSTSSFFVQFVSFTSSTLNYTLNFLYLFLSCKHSLVGRTMHFYIQGSGFESHTPHLFTL